MEFTVEILAMLFIVAALAGFIDAVAGGSGLITIPALVFAGASPIQAIATNKLQACFGSFSASLHFLRNGIVDLRRMPIMIAAVFVGAVLGALFVQLLDTELLMMVMPIALIAIALYSIFSKDLGAVDRAAAISDRQFSSTAAPAIGFYDGFFGPGTGTFFAIAYVKLLGMDFVRATAHAKVLNFTTNIASLVVFLFSAKVLLVVGFSMALGQLIGARLGAAMVIQKGATFIRLLTVIVCVAMSGSLIIKQL